MIRFAAVLEAMATQAGIAVAWIAVPLMIVTAALEPVGRWLGLPDAPLGEASTGAFLAATMACFGYAYAAGAHVRLDILSRHFSARWAAAIELAGSLLVVLPLCGILVIDGLDSTWRSFELGESWAETGLPLQWLVRLWIPAGFALLMMAGIASALRALLTLARG